MPFINMSYLVRQHCNQFVLGVHYFDQPGVEENEPGRGSKGVDLLVGNNKKVIVEVLFPSHLQNTLP
ncbi:MAG: hypothetical protein ACD_75C01666G0002 [uncultured bacterium]|nr:MAG: hypothetical protein ACD_75C01666G0002 [uncultured bacterium]